MKKGISLIVLVITIIVIIILAGALILNLSKNNPIDSAKKAQFYSTIETFKDELGLYIISKSAASGGNYDYTTLYADSSKVIENNIEDSTRNISKIISSIDNTKYKGNFIIENGVLTYVGENDNEITWASELNVKVSASVFVDIAASKNVSAMTLTVDIKVQNSAKTALVDSSTIEGFNLYISEDSSFNDTTPIKLDGNTSSTSYTKDDINVLSNYYIKTDVLVKSKVHKSDTIVSEKIDFDNDGLIAIIRDSDLEDGIYPITANGETYNVEVYNFNDDVEYTQTPTLGNTTVDSTMLVLKYNKNLTIGTGAVIRPQVRKKGMYVCVEGTLTNNGEITMTARGAIAAGQNVYLWKNLNNTYEYIPAAGGNGAARVSRASDGETAGIKGTNGTNRGTGGGGSGSACRWATATSYSGAGAAGTSYSGGAGGGGISARNSGSWYATAGAVNGGAGGAGLTKRDNSTEYRAGGGAGNNGGLGSINNASNSTIKGEDGTGGLLLIYANTLINESKISSNGSKGGGNNYHAEGGSSGAGSINVFVKNNQKQGTITATSPANLQGGAGGDGSITVTQVNY